MGWSVDDIMPGRDGAENSRILKTSQLRSWDWTMEAESRVSDFDSVQFLYLMAYQLFLGYLMPKPFS